MERNDKIIRLQNFDFLSRKLRIPWLPYLLWGYISLFAHMAVGASNLHFLSLCLTDLSCLLSSRPVDQSDIDWLAKLIGNSKFFNLPRNTSLCT